MTAAEEPRAGVGKRPWDKYPRDLHPKQRIFLSVDAIGSTRFKSSLAEKGHSPDGWAEVFAEFLPEVVVVYWNELVKVINKHCPSNCPNPCMPGLSKFKKKVKRRHTVNVWKYNGDETILTAKLTCKDHHASLHVLALAETIKELNCSIAKKFSNKNKGNNFPTRKLRFKGTAWIAGFPVANIELDLPGQTKRQRIKDFLGPSIDLGFRLSKFASDNKLIISASLAYLIVKESDTDEPYKSADNQEDYRLPLCFGGYAEVKGVKNDKHPLIWYAVNKTEENTLCHVETKELRKFLEEGPLKNMKILPFVLDDNFSDSEYEEMYKNAVDAQKKISGSPFYKKLERPATIPESLSESSLDLDSASITKRLSFHIQL